MPRNRVDQKKLAEWQNSGTKVEVRRISPHPAVLTGKVDEFDHYSIVLNGTVIYIRDISTINPT